MMMIHDDNNMMDITLSGGWMLCEKQGIDMGMGIGIGIGQRAVMI